MKITVKDSTTVTPEPGTPRTTLWLSNLDNDSPPIHWLILHFYRPDGSTDFFDVEVITAGLGRALALFYPLAGRLQKQGNRLEVDCNGKGVNVVVAEADGEIDELGDLVFVPAKTFTPPVDYSQGISVHPLLLVQVTRFKCGGICLGLGLNHAIVDGISAQNFINTWANYCRGLEVNKPPTIDRTALRARDPPHVDFTHEELRARPDLKSPADAPSKLKLSVFKFSPEQINALKEKCRKPKNGKEKNDRLNSSFEVLSGHTWQCVAKARDLPDNQLSTLYFSADARQRVVPPLPAGYFGNAAFLTSATASYADLKSGPLIYLVEKIHEASTRLNDEYIRSAIDYLELLSDVDRSERTGNRFVSPNCIVVSWRKLSFYDSNFGWGPPMYFGGGAPEMEEKILLRPVPEYDGGTIAEIALPEEQMEVFEKLVYDI